MDIDAVWGSGASDLAEAEATIEPVHVVFTPAAARAAHAFQQVQVAPSLAPSSGLQQANFRLQLGRKQTGITSQPSRTAER
jgi:hypothetical protein